MPFRDLEYVEPNIYKYRAADGSLRYCVRFKHRDRSYRKGGIRGLQQARDYVKKIHGQKVEQRLFPERTVKTAPTLKDYAASWLTSCELRQLKHNTLRSYRMNLNAHVVPALGHLRLQEITRDHVKQLLLAKKRQGLSPNSLRLVLAPLSKLFSDAIDEGLVSLNPCLRPGRITPVRRRKSEIDPFTRDEQQALLAGMQAFKPEDFPLLFTLVRAGLRIGEAVALERPDLDFANPAIIVSKNFTNGHLEAYPKNNKSRRVDMSARLVEVLKAHLQTQDLEAALKNVPPPRLVFPGKRGSYLDVKSWREDVFYALIDRVSTERVKQGLSPIRRRGPHHLRHTWATRLIENGESLTYIRDQAGHSSIQVTVDLYGHLVPGSNRAAVDRLDAHDTAAG
ncbi:tyrosine-type recombinase/integrase [Candidatus Nitrospira bockiana]